MGATKVQQVTDMQKKYMALFNSYETAIGELVAQNEGQDQHLLTKVNEMKEIRSEVSKLVGNKFSRFQLRVRTWVATETEKQEALLEYLAQTMEHADLMKQHAEIVARNAKGREQLDGGVIGEKKFNALENETKYEGEKLGEKMSEITNAVREQYQKLGLPGIFQSASKWAAIATEKAGWARLFFQKGEYITETWAPNAYNLSKICSNCRGEETKEIPPHDKNCNHDKAKKARCILHLEHTLNMERHFSLTQHTQDNLVEVYKKHGPFETLEDFKEKVKASAIVEDLDFDNKKFVKLVSNRVVKEDNNEEEESKNMQNTEKDTTWLCRTCGNLFDVTRKLRRDYRAEFFDGVELTVEELKEGSREHELKFVALTSIALGTTRSQAILDNMK